MSNQKGRITTLLGALVFACASFVSVGAQATIIQVFSPAGLTQGPYTLETFDDLDLVPGVTASAATGLVVANLAFAPSFPSGDTGLSTGSFPDPITFTFDVPASSVGMFFGNDDTCCASGFDAHLDIFNNAVLLGTVSVTANMNDAVDQFIGFISSELVTSVTIRYGSGTDVGLFTVVDDLYFNTAQSVAEPAMLGLLCLGLAGFGIAARRRKTR